MTYREFLKAFDEYKSMRVAVALSEYKNYREIAEKIGISPSTITRITQGKFKNDHRCISKLIGEDIEDIDITGDAAKQFQIAILEQKIKELKGK